MANKSGEIWSSRLQREILSLSHQSNSVNDTNAEGPESACEEKQNSNDNTKKGSSVPMLPPYVRVDSHTMQPEYGVCRVTFCIDVISVPVSEASPGAVSCDGENKTEEKDGEESMQREKSNNESKDEDSENNRWKRGDCSILVTLDTSMRNGPSKSTTSSYPFMKPVAILTAGSHLFPPNSEISDGDEIDIECDWTPSLHLSDAAMNVALMVRECIKVGEAFYAVGKRPLDEDDPINSKTPTKNSSSPFGAISESLMKNMPSSPNIGIGSFFGEAKMNVAMKNALKKQEKKKKISKIKPPSALSIGDTVNMNNEPYSFAGMFSCKAIRRPVFVEELLAEVNLEAKRREQENQESEDDDGEIPAGFGNFMKLQAGGISKVAGSGLRSSMSLLRGMTQATKSALEESFLMITDTHLMELRLSKLSMNETATVTFISPIALLAKLKFRRQESISLFFKQSVEDPLIYMCHDSAEAVHMIQNTLKKHGVRGKHTNAATQRAIQQALKLVVDIQRKEKSLEHMPSPALVEEIMDLYRQAAEKFETAGDVRHEEVMGHMHKFLAKPLIVSILDGSHESSVRSRLAFVDDEDDGMAREEAMLAAAANETPQFPDTPQRDDISRDESFKRTLQQADDILNEAKQDMFGFDHNDDLDHLFVSGGDSDDALAEFDAMLSAADRQLSDIMDTDP